MEKKKKKKRSNLKYAGRGQDGQNSRKTSAAVLCIEHVDISVPSLSLSNTEDVGGGTGESARARACGSNR